MDDTFRFLNQPSRRWVALSLVLLGVYLAFFHLTLNQSPRTILLTGIAFAHAWTLLCILLRRWFANGFEFAIHLLIAADIQIEALIPVHDGFGFYYCAAAFWIVFWIYHFGFTKRQVQKPEEPTVTQAATVA